VSVRLFVLCVRARLCVQSGPSALDFDFKPAMKEVARFELPANLALPKVANLTWSESSATDFYDGASTLASIAPSALNAVLNLPAIMDISASQPAIQDAGELCVLAQLCSPTL
jgi:hypothetical protein